MTRAGLLLVATGLVACDGPRSPRSTFDERVLPVLEARCAAPTCHGVTAEAVERGDAFDRDGLWFPADRRGRITDADAAYAAARRHVNTREDPLFSSLLRKPLGVGFGGLPHYGGANFDGPDDPALAAIADWIAAETDGGEDPPPLDPLERRFAETVQPALVEGTCTEAACHGPEAGATPFRLDPGLGGRFGVAATRHNYEATLRQVALDGDPWQSRLLRKSLPLSAGGIRHKGTNFDFYAGNPHGVEAIIDWICAERRARAGAPCLGPAEPALRAFVYVRGPVMPRHAFDLDAFAPGRDLFLARLDAAGRVVTTENLTAALHDAPADIRDPAVSPDGRRVLFAMRRRREEGHHLYVLDLETRRARRLTRGNGPLPTGGLATDRDPTWGPDGTVWFVSTRAGRVADGGRLLDADLYSLDPGTGELRRWTRTPHVERKPTFFTVGDEAGGEVGFTALRAALPGQARAHAFRFPPDLSTEYHQHFGITPPEDLFFDTREMPDGRYVAVVGDLDGVWRAGRLGIIDRNLGPELPSPAHEAAMPSYAPPLVRLDPDARSEGWTDGAWRDPAPLPDGRLLVARHPGRLDLADPDAAFTPRIELLTLEEAPDGGGPRIAERRVLLAEAGVALTDPEPVVVRAPLRASRPHTAPPGERFGVLHHHGLPMIDALLRNLAPTGPRLPRDDFRYVRLIEALPRTPAHWHPVRAPGRDGATTVGLGGLGPARILAELPLAPDGSFQARIPAGVPFRIQPLDERRMAVGFPHNRWFDLAPGQRLVQGLSVAAGLDRYETQCGACHGTADGRSGQPFDHAPPDALTGASLTLSRFERQDPRRPLPPPELGDATRIEVDFRRDVQPILDRSCGCHGPEARAAGLDLSGRPSGPYTASYESLLRPGEGSGGGGAYVDARTGSARRSFLMELLTGEELDAPRALATPGTPHPAEGPLDEDDVLTLIRWIDLGANFDGRED